MKKLIAVALVAAMTASLAACGSSSSSSSSSTSTTAAAAEAAGEASGEGGSFKIAYIVGNLGDKSFSDSGEAGMDVLRGRGYEIKTLEVGDTSKSDSWSDFMYDAIDDGYNMLVASSTYFDYMVPIAEEYPDIKFVCFDDKRDPEEIPENMTVIFYAQNEGSYLVGLMAAAMTETGVVGIDVGMDNPVINDFVTGFIEGVHAYDPDVKVVKASVGSWTDPAKMKTLVLDQAQNNNADVFYQVAGGSGDGLFEAVYELNQSGKKAWAIGVDSDQYEMFAESENPQFAEYITTSMLKEVGNSAISIVEKAEAGEDIWKQTILLGLANDSVGYVDNEHFQEVVPEDVRSAMADAKEKIKSGELKVKSYYDFADEAEYTAFVEAAK